LLLRAFVAADVSAVAPIARLQNEITSSAGWDPRDAKPVEPRNFHFTLIFLGEIAETDVSRIRSKLSELRFKAIEVSYTGVGAFPRADAARVVWVGVDEDGSQKLAGLAGTTISLLEGLGFKPDKPFSPHLTIFRAKGRRPISAAQIIKTHNSVIAKDRIDKVHLKKSELTPAGPVYSNVYTVEAESE
jgi:2'-5' RNA ligase